jgi:ribose 5-phosphate isomerase B
MKTIAVAAVAGAAAGKVNAMDKPESPGKSPVASRNTKDTYRIVIAADPFAVQLKDAIVTHLEKAGHAVTDVGSQVDTPVDHTACAPVACKALQKGEYDRAILICGTGMGMSIMANKYSGLIASCVETVEAARLCRALNHTNVLCLGQMLWGEWEACRAVDEFLSTDLAEGGFEGICGLLQRFEKEIDAIDRENRK